MAISYAVIYSGVLNYFAGFKQVNNISSLLEIFNYSFFILPLVLLFVPFYKPKIVFFQKTDPVRLTKRTMLEIMNQLFSSLFLLQIIIVTVFFLCAKPVSVLQSAVWIELLILSVVMRMIIQAVTNLKTRIQTIAAFIISAILIGAFIIFSHFILPIALFIPIAAAITFYHSLQFIYKQ